MDLAENNRETVENSIDSDREYFNNFADDYDIEDYASADEDRLTDDEENTIDDYYDDFELVYTFFTHTCDEFIVRALDGSATNDDIIRNFYTHCEIICNIADMTAHHGHAYQIRSHKPSIAIYFRMRFVLDNLMSLLSKNETTEINQSYMQ